MSLLDLQVLFAQCYAKMLRTPPTRHIIPGQHFKNRHHPGIFRQPEFHAPSKLEKRFAKAKLRSARGY